MSETKFYAAIEMFERAEYEFATGLEELGIDVHGQLRWDTYDQSLEIDRAANDLRLTEAQQAYCIRNGFGRVFVNHEDGWETCYTFGFPDPKPARGWRRFRKTDGNFIISYWPEAWGDPENGQNASWLRNGYMEIQPDPLDAAAGVPVREVPA